MPARSLYNRIAGQNRERLAALSDGVFAVAMTLLVLDLRAPAAEAIHTEQALWASLVGLAPRLVAYFMSSLTLGIFWLGQQVQLDRLTRSDRDLSWIHIAFLCAVTLVPFSTALLAEHITYRVALLVYWGNILLLGALLYWTWGHSVSANLLKDDTPPDVVAAICRRILIAQSLYALGAALCVVGTYWSIAFIALVQINYVVAPPWSFRR
jgi:uncharacterized membrane protein